jgi:hypothetical protein
MNKCCCLCNTFCGCACHEKWIHFSRQEPNLEKAHFISDGENLYLRGNKYFFLMEGREKPMAEIDFKFWMYLPSIPGEIKK